MMAGDEDDRKLFAGGLPQDAVDSDIREHFGQYGEIEGITLKTDPSTGRSRGFCFVVFKTVEGVNTAVAAAFHTIKGKKVAVKKAQAKQGKIYVGKLKPELSDDEIKNHFASFGTIAAIEQPFDKIKNERKNFCFITYEKEDVAKKLLKEGTVYINGHELDIKRVTQKDPRMMMGPGGPMGHGGPPMGGPYGGGPPMRGGRGGGPGWGGAGYGPPGQWGGHGGYGQGDYGNWGGPQQGYGDYYGGYGGGGGGGYGGYGGGYGGYPPAAGGKTPRGAGGQRGGFPMRGGRGGQRGQQRQKPY